MPTPAIIPRPNPDAFPALFDGLMSRRVIAYLIDLAILAVLGLLAWLAAGVLTLASLGLLAFTYVFLPLLPFLYHSLTLAGARAATPGMRVMNLRVMTEDGRGPDFFRAALHTLLFYATLALTGLLLLAAFFTRGGRCLHDMVAGLWVVRDPGGLAPL